MFKEHCRSRLSPKSSIYLYNPTTIYTLQSSTFARFLEALTPGGPHWFNMLMTGEQLSADKGEC